MNGTPTGMVSRLLRQLEQRGLWVEPGSEPGMLALCGPAAERTPDILRAVKAFKPELLKLFAPAAQPTPATPAEPAAEPDPEPEPRPEPELEQCPLCFAFTTPAEADRLCNPDARPRRYTLIDPAGVVTRVENPPCHYSRGTNCGPR